MSKQTTELNLFNQNQGHWHCNDYDLGQTLRVYLDIVEIRAAIALHLNVTWNNNSFIWTYSDDVTHVFSRLSNKLNKLGRGYLQSFPSKHCVNEKLAVAEILTSMIQASKIDTLKLSMILSKIIIDNKKKLHFFII